jgi:hypothetical protein
MQIKSLNILSDKNFQLSTVRLMVRPHHFDAAAPNDSKKLKTHKDRKFSVSNDKQEAIDTSS